jgi:hypothetical protein
MAKQLGKWKEASAVKECAITVFGWFRAACTIDPADPVYGILLDSITIHDTPNDN